MSLLMRARRKERRTVQEVSIRHTYIIMNGRLVELGMLKVLLARIQKK